MNTRAQTIAVALKVRGQTESGLPAAELNIVWDFITLVKHNAVSGKVVYFHKDDAGAVRFPFDR